jgi:hypothetical protein
LGKVIEQQIKTCLAQRCSTPEMDCEKYQREIKGAITPIVFVFSFAPRGNKSGRIG